MMRGRWAGMLVGLVFLVPIGLLLFASAGRRDLPWFWAYLATWASSAIFGPLVADPSLLRERLHPGPGAKDALSTALFAPLVAGQFLVAGLDVGRFHWSDAVSTTGHALGLLLVVVALAVSLWAINVNRFFSSVIRIQTDRGHRVVTSGPYRYVRHPAYAVSPLLFVGTGLALGSWLAVLTSVPLLLGVLRRTVEEDRVLHEELEGYRAYADKVPYRLLPGVW